MNKEWYDRECCWLDKQISDKKSAILKYIVNVPYLSNEVKEKIKAAFEKTCENTEVTLYSLFFRSLLVYENVTEDETVSSVPFVDTTEEGIFYHEWY